MTRPQRLDPEHGIHHVYSRGTRRWTLFIDRLDYERFIQRLGVVCDRYGISVFAYCLMGNHFHLVTYCPEQQLSAAMRDLKSAYARQHNERHNFSGPLFEARFGSKLVTSYTYLRTLGRYVHRNPLAVSPTAALEAYQWSSLAYYYEPTLPRPEWLDTHYTMAFFESAADYRVFVEANRDDDEHVGKPRKAGRGVKRQPQVQLSMASILLAVAAAAKCDVAEVRRYQRNGLTGLVVVLAAEFGRYTALEIAEPLGYSTSGGVYNAKRQTRLRIARDAHFSAIYEKVKQSLGQHFDEGAWHPH